MNYLPVSWCEGMFLRPHHFQASDRHGFEFAQMSEKWDHPCNYGIRTLELSDGAIAHFQFQVNVCHARMRDGSLVELNPGQEPDIVDLQAALAQSTEVTAYLAIPKLKIGSQNLAEKGAAGFRCRSRVGRVKRAPPKADRNRIGGARCALPTLQLFAFRT